uniref:Uncharacterized protein n=1 Tax=Tetranychus urticae TaxID=32264 RepID=T1K9E6_TETUR
MEGTKSKGLGLCQPWQPLLSPKKHFLLGQTDISWFYC